MIKMRKLEDYMKKRAAFEGAQWQLTEYFLWRHFAEGARVFFGVKIDEDGALLSDDQQPDFFEKYHRETRS